VVLPTPVEPAWRDPFQALPEIHLVVVEGPDGLGPRLRGHRSPFTIGAAPGSDLRIEHASVSGRHATLQLYPKGAVFLTDEGSTNGTWLAERRLKPGARERVEPDAILRFSRHVALRVEPAGDPAESPAPPAEVAPRARAPTIIAPVTEKKG